ncbi:MAG: NTP transferase domain-containing protein [Desulfotignum sp.]|nr:NTP transferase domain-containing protein [Desulfotignum sp.]
MSQLRTYGISAVILAAGFSSRMKAFKPLLPVGGKPMVQRCIDLFSDNGITDIVVVTGHNRELLEPVIRNTGACPVFHPGFASGMLGSIQQGVRHLRPGQAGFFLLPTDIPAIRPATVTRMIKTFRSDPHRIIVPCFKGLPGHPPLLPCDLKRRILALEDPSTLRDLMAAEKDRTETLVFHDRGILMDADDKDGYTRVESKVQSLDIPDKEECLSIVDQVLPKAHPIRDHLAQVTMTALKLAHAVSNPVNIDLVIAASLLHDVKRMEKNHDTAGAALLQYLGFPRVADVVEQHMNIELDPHAPVRETELVYFADKLCSGPHLDFNYHQRFRNSLEKTPWAATRIWKRYENTRHIQARIEASAGQSITEILAD